MRTDSSEIKPSPERRLRGAIWGGQRRAVGARKTRAGAALGAEHVEHAREHRWGGATDSCLALRKNRMTESTQLNFMSETNVNQS